MTRNPVSCHFAATRNTVTGERVRSCAMEYLVMSSLHTELYDSSPISRVMGFAERLNINDSRTLAMGGIYRPLPCLLAMRGS